VQPGRWHFLATTLDGSKRRVAFYADGRKIREEPCREALTVAFGAAQIGNAAVAEPNGRSVYGFRGRIDELAIFARALSDRDIEDLYQSGKP
jgi:hypothetical protein